MKQRDGMFGLEFVKEKLLQADKNIALEFPGERFEVFIVGGAALMLLGHNDKMTNDIDVLYISDKKICSILFEGEINQRVTCTTDSFSTEYDKRATKLDLGQTRAIDFYILSFEDIVSSKLYAGRNKDMQDLNHPNVFKLINWDVLDEIIYSEMKMDAMNERRWKDLVYTYEKYKEGYYEWKKTKI